MTNFHGKLEQKPGFFRFEGKIEDHALLLQQKNPKKSLEEIIKDYDKSNAQTDAEAPVPAANGKHNGGEGESTGAGQTGEVKENGKTE